MNAFGKIGKPPGNTFAIPFFPPDKCPMDRQERIVRLARAAGWSAEAVSMWRKRGHVPHRFRLTLARMAEDEGERLETVDFEGWRTKRGPRANGAA
jgi:hypothetical protein